MGLFYYSSANGADYTVSVRNPPVASATKGSPLSSWSILQLDRSKIMRGERAVVSHERLFGGLLAYEFFRFVRYPPLFLPATPSEHDQFARVEG